MLTIETTIAVYGSVTVDISVSVRPSHKIPPDSITNLTALTADYTAEGEEGKIELYWTAPQTGWNIQVKDYYIRWSTNSLADLLYDTTAWWNKATADGTGQDLYNWWSEPGADMNYTVEPPFNILTPKATYYFAIKAVDEFDNEGDIDFKTKSGIQAYAVASWDDIPPANITNLSALTGGGAGEIDLAWTAPGDDGMTDNISGGKYRLRWSTYNVSDWESDWDNSVGEWDDWQNRYSRDIDTDTVTGEDNAFTVTGLGEAALYYIKIWTADEYENWSSTSNSAYAQTRTLMLDEPIDNLTALTDPAVDAKIDLKWTSIGGEHYLLRYSTNPFLGDTAAWWNAALDYPQAWLPVPVDQEQEEFCQNPYLIAGTSYWFSIRAVNVYGSTSPVGNVAGAIAGDKVPDAPTELTLTFMGDKIKVTWNPNAEPDIRGYRIYRKKGDGEYEVIVSTHLTTEYMDSDIELGNTYTYKLRAIDHTDNVSSDSEEKSILAGDDTVYDDVGYIRITKITGTGITFEWEQVSSAIKGYAIERTDDPVNEWTRTDFVYSTASLSYTVAIEEKAYWYRIVTVSRGEITRSAGLMAIDTSEEFNHIYMSRGGDSWTMVPYECARELYPENNNGIPVKIVLEKENKGGGFLLSYKIKAVKENKVLTDFIFNNTRKGARIVFSYRQPGQSEAVPSAQNGNRQLALFWHNGVEWIKLGGIDDKVMQRVYTRSRRLGRFGIKYASLADKFTLNKVIPRIFTPDLPLAENPVIDGQRVELNVVHFYFENPNYVEVTIKIFDITGAEIRRNLRRIGENEMIWDGRDSGGRIVRGGIYIYQVEAEGKVVNGTIVIAK